MSFLDDILARLETAADQPRLTELRESGPLPATGRELGEKIAQARGFLVARGMRKGDRCALLAANGIDWVAMDLAIMTEGLIVVPLYSRQAPAELVAMMKDCAPSLICCGDAGLRGGILENWPEAPAQVLFEDVFAGESSAEADENPHPSQRTRRMGHPGALENS